MQPNDRCPRVSHRYLLTAKVVACLRMKARKIPIWCGKVTGKLFPGESVDLRVMNHPEIERQRIRAIPPVLAGSDDPLLNWSIREGLAILCHSTGDGARRLREGDAMVAGMRLLEPDSDAYNHPGYLGGGMMDLNLSTEAG